MSSIRGALRSGLFLATAATFLVAGVALERGTRQALLDDLDRSLRERALWVTSTVELAAEGLDLGFKEFSLQEFEPGRGESLLELFGAGDSVLYRSPSLRGSDLAPPGAARDTASLAFERTRDGRHVRTYRLRFRARIDPELETPPPAPEVALALGRDMAGVEALLRRLRMVLATVGVAAVLLLLAFLRLVVRRSLRPLQRIAGEIGALDTTQLGRRIGSAGAPSELEPVVRRLNELLDRLHASFERERTFSADIAHELRTPLAGIRTALEVELSRPRDAESYRETIRGSLAILLQMQTLAETLLQLARLDAGLITANWADTDLAALVRTVLIALEPQAHSRGLRVSAAIDGVAPVRTDPALLGSAVRNILDNAVAHAGDGAPIDVAVTSANAGARLTVRNAAPGLTQQEVPRLFERFARRDDARSSQGGHHGLGLALVQRIAAALGCRIEARIEAGETFVFVLEVPGHPPQTPPAATR